MARHELIRGMASSGHIPFGNHAVHHLQGPAPASAFSYRPDLRPRGLSPVTHGSHTLGIPRGGCIPEFTCEGGLAPSLITGQGQDFHPGSLRPVAHGELTRGMARGDRILQCPSSATAQSRLIT
jgi:hypothetical protein